MSAMVLNPLYAFAAAWHYRRNLLFSPQKIRAQKTQSDAYLCTFCSAGDQAAIRSSKTWNHTFGSSLSHMCSGPDLFGADLNGEIPAGLYVFWNTIGMLMDSWVPLRAEREPNLYWHDLYPKLIADVRRAQMARCVWTARPNFFEKLDLESGTLVARQRLRGQRTYTQAAKTAAYVLWGDFLAQNPSSVDFCEVCQHPFPPRSSKRFYPPQCGNNSSSLKAHRLEIRRNNWERLRESARTLRSGIEAGRRRHHLLDGIATERWLTRFIRAAAIPPESMEHQSEWEKLFDLCLEDGSTLANEAEVRKTLDQFLKDIATAQSYMFPR